MRRPGPDPPICGIGRVFSTDVIYGSGLRNDFANTGHLPLYTQVNAGISHEFKWDDFKPTTVRFDVINVFDTIHEIRDAGVRLACSRGN
jgi:hypothetical protein